MTIETIDTLSLPADHGKANEDAFATSEAAAAVLDGATMLNEPLLPGRSDAAWIAHFGARRLIAHLSEGDAPREALRHALEDAQTSFAGLWRRPPKEIYETPCASLMLVAEHGERLHALWFGDCAALVLRPGETAEMIGDAIDKRAAESRRVAMLVKATGLVATAGSSRAEFLPYLRLARNTVNSQAGGWLFSPDPEAAGHAAARSLLAPAGTLLLLATDGFLALASDYGAYGPQGLVEAARDKGLSALGEELRAVERDDSEGRKFPRFKTSDDATAVLLRIT